MMQGVIVRIALGVFGVLTVAMLLLAIFNDKGALQVRAQSQKLDTLESEIKKLENENKQLTDEIQALRSDPATIEKFAREELKLVKPGEVVLVAPDN
jgi:cell division protein FtsL